MSKRFLKSLHLQPNSSLREGSRRGSMRALNGEAAIVPAAESNRAVDWLAYSRMAIEARCPQAKDHAERIAGRLAALLLDRLPPGIAVSLVEILPESTRKESRHLLSSASAREDTSIGYLEFIERCALALGQGSSEEVCHQVADEFLAAAVRDLPIELKTRMREVLPAELKSRMALYQDTMNEARVA